VIRAPGASQWDTGLDRDEAGRAVRWAVGEVRRLWPALDDPALSRLVAAYAPPRSQSLTTDEEE